MGSGALWPQRGAGRSPAAFSRHGQNDREAGVLPMPVLPIPNPMDEVHGGKMFRRQLNSWFGYGQNSYPGQLYSVYVKKPKILGGYDTEITRHLPESNLTDKEELFRILT